MYHLVLPLMYRNEDLIRRYVEDQGKTYEKIFEGQLKLF